MPFRLLDHTADIAIEAEGATREEALCEAALALVGVVTGRAGTTDPLRAPETGVMAAGRKANTLHRTHGIAHPDREITFTIDAPDLGALAVAFLAEILWILASQDALWLGGGVTIRDIVEPPAPHGFRLDVRGNVVAYDPVQHGRGVEVKAVTYHDLLFAPVGLHGKGPWRLRVVLDI